MSSTSETGHAKNVANFKSLTTFCKSYGPDYNPSREALTLTALNNQSAAAVAALKAANTANAAAVKTINNRTRTFRPLKPFCTRIINSLEATGASKETIKAARAIIRKIQGQRAPGGTKKPAPIPAQPQDEKAAIKAISVSQQSHDQQVEHFSKLLELLATEDNYTPNETDLTLPALQAKLEELTIANTKAGDAITDWKNSLIARNTILYAEETGLVAIALAVKKYVLSVYNANSPSYKQVNSIEFKTQKAK